MKNHHIALILIAVSALSCNLFDGQKRETAAANRPELSSAPKPSPAECTTSTLSVNETKNEGLKKYEGCLVSLRGKIWEVRGRNAIALIDTSERTDYNHVLSIAGDFSGATYYEIGRKISDLKINGDYDRLPTATFTGTVETASGYSSLKNSILTEVQK
jgi:hypothetical protein